MDFLPDDMLCVIGSFLLADYGPMHLPENAKYYCRLRDGTIPMRLACTRFYKTLAPLIPPKSLRYPCCSVQELCDANLTKKIKLRPKGYIGHVVLAGPMIYQRMWGISPKHNCTAHDCHHNHLFNLHPAARELVLPKSDVIERMQECLASLIRQSEEAELTEMQQIRPLPLLHMPSWNFMADFNDFLARAGIFIRHIRPFVSKAEGGGVLVQWVDFMDQPRQTLLS